MIHHGEGETMFCPKCGAQLPDGAKFCGSCGFSLDAMRTPGTAANASASTSTPAVQQTPKTSGSLVIRRGLIALGSFAAIVVAVVAVVFFVLPRVFGGGASSQEEAATQASLSAVYGLGTGAAGDGAEYFYSTNAGGICRSTGPNSVEVIYPVDNEEDYVSCLTAEGGRIYFVKSTYTSMYSSATVYSIAANGSDEKSLYHYELPEDSYGNVNQIRFIDGRMYLLCTTTSDGGSFSIVSLNKEGDDERELGTVDMPATAVLIMPDAVYFTNNSYSQNTNTTGSLYRTDFVDGELVGAKEIYKSLKGSASYIALINGRLYLQEENYSAGRFSIVSLNEDGSDAKTVYEAKSGMVETMEAVNGGDLYLKSYESDPTSVDGGTWNLLKVPVSSGKAATIAEGLTYYNASIANTGKHLLIAENGQYQGSMGERIASIGFDGSSLTDYNLG